MKIYPLKCRIQARTGGAPARIDVYDDIGGDAGDYGGGLGSKEFAAQLAGVKGGIDVHINSAGGDVFEGIAIRSALEGHQGDVTTIVDGLAASIASVIFQAGRKRLVRDGAMVMIHDASGAAAGNATEMAAMSAALEKVSDNIAGIYAARSGTGTAESWRKAMRAETWYTADEAVQAGPGGGDGDGGGGPPRGVHNPPIRGNHPPPGAAHPPPPAPPAAPRGPKGANVNDPPPRLRPFDPAVLPKSRLFHVRRIGQHCDDELASRGHVL